MNLGLGTRKGALAVAREIWGLLRERACGLEAWEIGRISQGQEDLRQQEEVSVELAPVEKGEAAR